MYNRISDIFESERVRRMMRFITSGAISSLVEYGTFVLMVYFTPIVVLVAQPLSFMCGVGSSYSLNRFWVFRAGGSHKKSMTMFVAVAACNATLSTILMYIAVEVWQANELIAKLLIMAAIAVWNYLIFSRVIFTK